MVTNDCDINKKRRPKELTNAAIDFVSFLYKLWIKKLEYEIMEEDKTICNNEEPANIN